MEIREYRVPERPGELLCDPPLAQWEQVIEANRARAEAWAFSLLGLPGAELRRRARRRLWNRPETDRLIVTGHQPVFFHAGIWIKALAVRRAAAAMPRTAGYHVNVDSDEAPDLGVWLPYGAPGDGSDPSAGGGPALSRKWVPLGSPSSLPLERRQAPTQEEWASFAREGEALLSSLAPGPKRHELVERWRRFMGTGYPHCRDAPGAAGGDNLARFMVRTRRSFEALSGASGALHGRPAAGEPFLEETCVSEVAQTPEFLHFALAWMAEAAPLARLYNGLLAAYRRLRRYRSKANPFPDLRRYGDQIEIPFWCGGPGGERADLFVVSRAGDSRISLHTRHGERLGLDLSNPAQAVEALAQAELGLRPKAVPLTLFLRLFASDLFVHGVGGGRYDHITDGVMRGWLGVDPPRYAVVSASLPLPLLNPDFPDGGFAGEIAHWKHQLRALKFNPQRFVPEGDGSVAPRLLELKTEKEELIRAIGEPGAPKRALTRRIEAVNRALSEGLAPLHRETMAALRASEHRQRAWLAAAARDYPFFLHRWETLWQALDEAKHG